MQDADPHGMHDAEEHGHGHAPERRSFYQAFVVPIGVPAIAALVIFGIILAISQILLAVGGTLATMVALIIAIIVLAICSYLASARRLQRGVVTTSIAVPVIALAIAGIGARVYRVNNHETKGTAAAAISPQITTDNKFSVTSYTVPANTPIDIPVMNQGQAIHNMDILGVKDAVTGADIKTPSLVQAGTTQDLKFTIAQPGTYKFQCDVHPTEMIGQITVTPSQGGGAAAGAAGAPGGPVNEVTSDNNGAMPDKFSVTSIDATVGKPVTINVQNQGKALHNWHLLDTTGVNGTPMTPLLQPSQTGSLTLTFSQAGTFNFQCDVHPTEMKGAVTVK